MKLTGIYKITSPSGKIYIGQSTDIDNRKYYYEFIKCKGQFKIYNSLLKYSWKQHKFEIIEECSEEQLNKREIYWGLKFKVLGPNGLNLKLGNAKGKCNEELKKKIGLANSKPKPEGFGEKQKKNKPNNPNLAKILKYKKEILKLYDNKSILEISKLISLDYNTIKLFLIKEGKYEKNKNHKQSSSQKEKMKQIMINKLGVSIIQQDKNSNLIQEYPSQAEAFRQTRIKQSCISACCIGKQKTAGGFIWKYKNN